MTVHLSADLQTPCLRSSAMLLICLALILSSVIEALQVIGGDKTVVEKGTVVLPCRIIDNKETLTQISWQRKTRGKPQNDNFLTILDTNEAKYLNGKDQRFKFIGDINEGNGSLQLSNVTLKDEGTYTCVVTLFPSGNHPAVITLNLLVPPVSSLKDNPPLLGNEEVPLVTCTAAGSKPPAEVKWLTGTLAGLNVTTTNVTHDNGTTTTVSSLSGVPTIDIYEKEVKCVVTSAAPSGSKTLTYSIQIYFTPIEVEISKGKDPETLECSAKANPKADFTWSRDDDDKLPPSAVANGATLRFQSKTTDNEGLYYCTASNTHGSMRGALFMDVIPGKSGIAGWILFALLLFLNVAAAAVWYLKFRRYQAQYYIQPQENGRMEVPESDGDL
ncbi:poliovirus receptor isoform X1 [Larimichthys crocea]|uniref:poliovirus receptor isoform X1 n=1 Tax=Larimichthys crocea TaxID=215358 RepID=UPI000F5ED703|nr:poliovirus receptor isoform X1 [Larimichthys crocea]XP_027146482.1 poliovirus receptor isoform X1 [Larimichthys crocea]